LSIFDGCFSQPVAASRTTASDASSFMGRMMPVFYRQTQPCRSTEAACARFIDRDHARIGLRG
jgi:hypothetical protein